MVSAPVSLANLIRRMTDAGAPPEAIALAVEEIEALQLSLSARRVADRDRKREQRERLKSADVTGQSEDSPGTVTPKGSLEVSPLASPLPNPSQVISPPNTPQIFEEKKRAIASCLRKAFPTPDGVTDEQWGAFRKQRRKPLNDRSYALVCNKLLKLAEDGWPPGDMIDLAIERGWETVFAPRTLNHGQSSSNVTSLRGSRPDPALDLYRAACAAEDREDHLRAGPSLPAIGSG